MLRPLEFGLSRLQFEAAPALNPQRVQFPVHRVYPYKQSEVSEIRLTPRFPSHTAG